MDGIQKVMGWFGIICIVGGILIGGYLFFNVEKETYDAAKEVAEELFDNPYAIAELQGASAIYYAELTFALSILFGGLVVGLFFVGFARLIDIVEDNQVSLNGKLSDINRNILESGTRHNAS
jgi:hypothetical protein